MKRRGGIFGFVSGAAFSAAWLIFSAPASAQGFGRWTVGFDGVPRIARGTEKLITSYSEAGMLFTPIGDGQFGRSGGGRAAFADNGTAYLFAGLGDSLSARLATGRPFGLESVDLAEFSTLYQTPLTVRFVGYKQDGSTVSTEFVTDGIIDGTGPLADFQTFPFDPSFSDVVRFEVPTIGWSLDNLVYFQIPEPAPGALLALGTPLVWAARRRRLARTTGAVPRVTSSWTLPSSK